MTPIAHVDGRDLKKQEPIYPYVVAMDDRILLNYKDVNREQTVFSNHGKLMVRLAVVVEEFPPYR